MFVARLWRTVKHERVYKMTHDSVSEAMNDIAICLNEYNDKMPHSSLADRTPDQAYWQRLPTLQAAA